MPEHELPLILVTRHLEGRVRVGEALFFPEVVGVYGDGDRLHGRLRELARELLAGDGPAHVYRRLAGATPDVHRLGVRLEPPRKSVAWAHPITLHFDVLRWRHGDEATIAYLPSLGIEVAAPRDDQVDALVEKNVRVTLARTRIVERLFDLAQLDRVQSVDVGRELLTADIPTPTQATSGDARKREKARPVIATAGVVLADADTPPAYEVDRVVERLADVLAGRRPQSALLVGPSGVGKTAAFQELFRQRGRHGLGHAPFWATSGARLIAGTSGYGLWQERCQTLCREARAAGAILHLGNLVELTEVGKAGGSQFGIASFFRPYLARGDVLAVAECTPEQLPLIERANPHLLAAFHVVRVDEPSPAAVKAILARAAGAFMATGLDPEGRARFAPIRPDAIDMIDRLHRRYATYSAAPGRPLRFLRNLLQDRAAAAAAAPPDGPRVPEPPPLAVGDVTAAFARETGLPLLLLDDATPLDLDAARREFSSRVIGQPEAVDLVTDLLVTVKAALNRPRRPIASLLFVGPTGVGKTEMAKALADFFFGDSGGARLVRFDMSEYATPAAVARLVGTAWDAEGLLTRRVREQPFCVVLLDEFEKADPSFFDLLLQVLGEARLTDPAGRVADFSNAVVCMTSNLGADDFGAGPFGLARDVADAPAHARGHFTDALQEFLRPELFNRIDRVVPFLPLGPETLERIAAREIELIGRRDGVLRRDVRLDVTPAAVRHLARAGYDPLYGARPLKRRVEQDLLAPLSDAINAYAPATPLDVRVDVVAERLGIDCHARGAGGIGSAPAGVSPGGPAVAPLARRAAEVRRRVQAVARCPANLALQNELFTLNRLGTRADAHPGARFTDPLRRDRVRRLEMTADALARLSRDAVALEDATLLHLYEGAPLSAAPGELDARLASLETGTGSVLLELFSMPYPQPHALCLGLFGAGAAGLFTLAKAYHDLVLDRTDAIPLAAGSPVMPSIAVSYYARLGKSAPRPAPLGADEVAAFLASRRPGVLGIVLAVTSPFARARFETEGGLHVIQEGRDKHPQPVWVDASLQARTDYAPPKDVEFRVALAGRRRRTYTLDRKEADDAETGQTYRWTGKAVCEAVRAATSESLRRRLETVVNPPAD